MQENLDKKITLQIHPRNFELSYNRFRAYNRDKLQQVQYLFLTLIYIPYGPRSVILKTILIKMAQPNKNLYLPGIKSPFINPKMYLVIVMMSMLYVGVQQHNDVNKYDNILPNFH